MSPENSFILHSPSYIHILEELSLDNADHAVVLGFYQIRNVTDLKLNFINFVSCVIFLALRIKKTQLSPSPRLSAEPIYLCLTLIITVNK